VRKETGKLKGTGEAERHFSREGNMPGDMILGTSIYRASQGGELRQGSAPKLTVARRKKEGVSEGRKIWRGANRIALKLQVRVG
jgi:hypothetical protein